MGVLKIKDESGQWQFVRDPASDQIKEQISKLQTKLETFEPKYEKIATFTLDENSSSVMFTNEITEIYDQEGNVTDRIVGDPIKLSSFYIEIIAGFVDGSASTLYININGQPLCGNAPVGLGANLDRGFYARFYIDNVGLANLQVTASMSGCTKPYSSQSNMAKYHFFPPNHNYFKKMLPINKIELYTLLPETGTKQWLKGSKFILWGVKNNESV